MRGILSLMTSSPRAAPLKVLDWLLDSDPSIRWQVMHDLTDEPEDVVAAERSRVAIEGFGARLLTLQAPNGQWGGGTYLPKWTSTTYTLMLLRDLGIDPTIDQVRAAVDLVRVNVRHEWTEMDSRPFFEGEIEPCINGMTLAVGSYFGVADANLVDRLLEHQLPDGGWNCEAPPSTVTSIDTTISVLEGLLEYEESVGGVGELEEVRARAHEYLLDRRMFRARSTGEVIDPNWTLFTFPTRWPYDVLRGLDYLRRARLTPDERMDEALDMVERTRQEGRWLLHDPYPGEYHFSLDEGVGRPSRWITLRALRVLRWADRA